MNDAMQGEPREELLRLIGEVRERIADCLFEIDRISLQENPRILADYAIKIGCVENELVRRQLAARRAKRKYAIAQAKANAGEPIDEGEIESQLDEELSEWERELQQRVRDYLEALGRESCMRAMTPPDARELKRLHRTLVARLHPDLHPELGEEGVRFFTIAQLAYENGNLEMLRSIEAATEHLTSKPLEDGTIEELGARYEVLQAQLSITEERLRHLKDSEPYALAEKLADARWVCERVDDLKGQIAAQEQVRAAYEQRFEELRGAEHGR